MKKNLSVILFSLLALSILPKKQVIEASDPYSWYAAFYNDVDNDGTKECLPLIYHGTVTQTIKYRYTQANCVDRTNPKYNYPDEEYLFDEYDRLYEKYDIDPWDKDWVDEYLETLEEGSASYNEAHEELYNFLELADQYDQAEALYQEDVNNFAKEHPEIKYYCNYNPNLDKTTTYTDSLLYYLHIPFDYDPAKSYPVFVLANGESNSWTKPQYINDDESYKETNPGIPDAWQMNSLYTQWYNQVKNPGEGRDKYDCFFISIINSNEFFRGYGNGSIGLVNQQVVPEIKDAYYITTDMTGDSTYKATYKPIYDASFTTPAYQEQLVCQLIDDMMKTYNIDPTRQYVSGFSLGGIFTMDIISNYPDRFAAAIPLCSAGCDISDENVKRLTNTNVWAISGANDGTCSKYISKCFTDAINNARNKYKTGTNCVAQYSFFAGGHSGGHYKNQIRDSSGGGVNFTYSNQLLDFLFESKRTDYNVLTYKNNLSEIENVKTYIQASTLENNTFDLALLISDISANYSDAGIKVKVTFNDDSTKEAKITNLSKGSSIKASLKDKTVSLDASLVNSYSCLGTILKDIPSNLKSIELTPYYKTGSQELYGKTTSYNITITDNIVEVK